MELREIPKEYRPIVRYLVRELNWRYDRGRKHPRLWPADGKSRPIVIPTTPGDHRSLANLVSQIRAAGAELPPELRRKR